jgi:multicomponent Na+:H+ antiporter subunit D
MNLNSSLLVLTLLSSLLPGAIIFFLSDESVRLRTTLNLTGSITKLSLIAIMLWGIINDQTYHVALSLLPGMTLTLNADALSMFFVTLSGVLWFVTTIYAIGYLEGSPHRSRFFGFYSIAVTATVGIALAGNLITFLLFYELLTLATYPLVIHRGTKESLRAGRIYLIYTLTGGAVLLAGVAWLRVVVGPVEFASGGVLAEIGNEHRETLILIFALLIAGLGVKAALFPLHGWLPIAMIAPAPVSALLHAVAVVKAGAFGIVRVVYDVYGVEFAADLGVTAPLAVLAAFTIVYGSVRALFQDNLKRRLAYSTISQVSYIALGVAIAGPIATVGGLVHLVHQGLMKITLFLCAGNLAATLEIHDVSDMKGVARRMPWTMAAFSTAAIGMIGVPPLAGFISKWFLGMGGLEAGQSWVVAVLVVSSLLNAAYFLPIIYAAWFRKQEGTWTKNHHQGRLEANWLILIPPLVTALFALGAGFLANSPVSPLEWAKLITRLEYGP